MLLSQILHEDAERHRKPTFTQTIIKALLDDAASIARYLNLSAVAKNEGRADAARWYRVDNSPVRHDVITIIQFLEKDNHVKRGQLKTFSDVMNAADAAIRSKWPDFTD